jgi:hypothetical protein
MQEHLHYPANKVGRPLESLEKLVENVEGLGSRTVSETPPSPRPTRSPCWTSGIRSTRSTSSAANQVADRQLATTEEGKRRDLALATRFGTGQ